MPDTAYKAVCTKCPWESGLHIGFSAQSYAAFWASPSEWHAAQSTGKCYGPVVIVATNHPYCADFPCNHFFPVTYL